MGAYLSINPDDIEIYFGKYALLKNAKFPLGIKKNIKIPIDNQGSVITSYSIHYTKLYDVFFIIRASNSCEENSKTTESLIILAVSSLGK